MVPKNMIPKKEEWEKLGFVFEDIGDDVLYKATLPEGWNLVLTDNLMWVEIVDDNNLKRGSIFYKLTNHNMNAHMALECRYDIYSEYIDENQNEKEIYFGNPNEKLFVAGMFDYCDNDKRDVVVKNYFFENQLKDLAKAYANEYYPNWHNVNAYWNEKELTKTRKIK